MSPNPQPTSPLLIIEEIRKNFMKCCFLVLILIIIILGIGCLLGYYLDNLLYGLIIALGVCVIMIPIQLFTARWAILNMVHGEPLDNKNPIHNKLRSITEGLSIAAGINIPDLYIIPSSIPNAFASGMSEQTAFIGLTEGIINKLTVREVTGVIAHEISHIVHRDIMLSQITIALVSVILFLSAVVSRLAFFGSPRGSKKRIAKGKAGLFVLIIVLCAFLLRPLATLISKLLMLAISREREYAADAYAVRLCGYNEGLASALEKISKIDEYDSEDIQELGGEQMKCMYIHFSDVDSLFSTHPPIQERVKRLRNMY